MTQNPYDPPTPPPGYPPPYAYPQPGFGMPPFAANQAYPPDPGAPYGRDRFGRPLSDKTKLVAGLLQIFLGGLGIGRFYTGDIGLAVAQLVVSFVTCGVGSVWGLIDGIMLLVRDDWADGKGLILRA